MPTAVTYPAPTTTSKPVTVNGQTATFTHKEYEMVSELSLAAINITGLPSGQYRYMVQMTCDPSDLSAGTTTFTATSGTGVTSISVPACLAMAYKDLPPRSRSGTWYFSIEIQVNSAGNYIPYSTSWTGTSASSATFSAAPAPVSPTLKVGSTLHMVIPDALNANSFNGVMARMAAAGLKYVSCAMPWSYWAPTSSAIDPARQTLADGYFAAVAANGLKAIVTLHSIPAAWGATGGVFGNPPASWTNYDNWVDYVLGRYGANIVAVGGMNEPNSTNGSNAYYIGSTPQVISNLVTETQHLYNRTRASAYSSTITVLNPALAFGEVAYLKLLLDAGIGSYIDGVNHHPYDLRFDTNIISDPRIPWKDHSADFVTTVIGDSNSPLSACHKIQQLMNSYGYGTKPQWVCELGWSHTMGGPIPGLDATATLQADYTVTTLKQLARVSYVQAVCPYEWRDNANGPGTSVGDMIPEIDITVWNNRWGYAENFNNTEQRPGGDAVAGTISNGFVGSSFIDYTRIGTTISGSSPKTWGNG